MRLSSLFPDRERECRHNVPFVFGLVVVNDFAVLVSLVRGGHLPARNIGYDASPLFSTRGGQSTNSLPLDWHATSRSYLDQVVGFAAAQDSLYFSSWNRNRRSIQLLVADAASLVQGTVVAHC